MLTKADALRAVEVRHVVEADDAVVGLPLVSLTMQLLLHQLITECDGQRASSKLRHDFAIMKLNVLAPLYALEFKQARIIDVKVILINFYIH